MSQSRKETGCEPSPPVAPKKLRGRRLYSLGNVRTLVADVLREVEDDDPAQLPPAARIARARTLIYGAQVLAECIKSADIEERLAALEGRRAA